MKAKQVKVTYRKYEEKIGLGANVIKVKKASDIDKLAASIEVGDSHAVVLLCARIAAPHKRFIRKNPPQIEVLSEK